QALWTARYTAGPRTNSTAYAVGVSPDGSMVFVTGASYGPGGATVAYDAATGAQLWVTPSDATPQALAVSPDGARVFVAGTMGVPADYVTIAYDAATGGQLWVTRYDVPGISVAYALGVSPDGQAVFVTGETTGAGSTNDDYTTIAYSSVSGLQLWIANYNGTGDRDDTAYALGVSPDGSHVFVTGSSYGQSTTDIATVAYDAATGGQSWVARYADQQDGDAFPTSLGVSPDGSAVFVAGVQSIPSVYITIAYTADTGPAKWAPRSAQLSKGSEANALAVSPDGADVFVTGWFIDHNGFEDFATVAYPS